MFSIEMLPAGHGDCLWIEYGPRDALKRILIDGGTCGTYKRLKQRILALPEEDRKFELLIVTHIDADHIAGALKLIEEDLTGLTFTDIWFNGWRHLPKSSLESLGPVQGERLTTQLISQQWPWNHAFKGYAVIAETETDLQEVVLEGGMRLTLLSPTAVELKALKPVWIKELKKAGLDPQEPSADEEDPNTLPSTLERLGAAELPDIDALADTPYEPDHSEANGSSIAVLAEYNGKSALFSGDAFPEVLKSSLERLYAKRNMDRLSLTAFKLPHHGSQANLNIELLEKIDCNRYLVSTNGAYHQHPDEATLAKVIKYGGPNPQILFNYSSEYNKIWSNPLLQAQYGFSTRYPEQDMGGLCIQL